MPPLTPGTRLAEAQDTDQVGVGFEGSGPAWSSSRTLSVRVYGVGRHAEEAAQREMEGLQFTLPLPQHSSQRVVPNPALGPSH